MHDTMKSFVLIFGSPWHCVEDRKMSMFACILSLSYLSTVTPLILPMSQGSEPDVPSIINHVTALEQTLATLTSQVQSTTLEMTRVKSQLEMTQDDLKTSKQEAADLKSELTASRALIASTFSTLTSEVDSLKDSVKGLTSKMYSNGTLQTSSQTESQSRNFNELRTRLSLVENGLNNVSLHQNKLEHSQAETMSLALSSASNITDLKKQVMALNLSSSIQPATPVAFQVVLQRDSVHFSANEILKFDSVTYNKGNAYNSYTGIFTCPMAGTYLFWANIESDNKGFFAVSLVKENRPQVGGYTAWGNEFGTASLVYVSHVDKGQSVYFKNIQHGEQTVLDGKGYSSYGGVFLGA